MTRLAATVEHTFETFDRHPALRDRGLGCYSLRMLDWLSGDFLAPHINVMAITRYGKEPARVENSFDFFFSSEKTSRVRTHSSMDELHHRGGSPAMGFGDRPEISLVMDEMHPRACGRVVEADHQRQAVAAGQRRELVWRQPHL
jgi:hypothetical protein